MNNKKCTFNFNPMQLDDIKKLVKNDEQTGLDNLDGKLVRIIADYIAEPVCHILNLSLKESMFPQAWKVAKIIPLSKDN